MYANDCEGDEYEVLHRSPTRVDLVSAVLDEPSVYATGPSFHGFGIGNGPSATGPSFHGFGIGNGPSATGPSFHGFGIGNGPSATGPSFHGFGIGNGPSAEIPEPP